MKNYISDKDLKSYMIIAMILGIIFWSLFMFLHSVFLFFAITTNAIQVLLLIEGNYRKNLTKKR